LSATQSNKSSRLEASCETKMLTENETCPDHLGYMTLFSVELKISQSGLFLKLRPPTRDYLRKTKEDRAFERLERSLSQCTQNISMSTIEGKLWSGSH
jgi:hypothetical protein